MLSGHRTLAREFPFLCSGFRKVSTFGTTASHPTIRTGGGVRRIRGGNFDWTSQLLRCQKPPSNATLNPNSPLGSHSGNQCLLSGVTVSALGFTERSNRRGFSTSVSLLAQTGHEELSENTDNTTFNDRGGGQVGGDTGSRVSRRNADNNGRVLKVSRKKGPLEIWKMIRVEVAKFLRGEIKEEIKEEKVSPIPTEPLVEKELKDPPREIPDEAPFVLQSSYADGIIEELKQPETQEQFVEQGSYSSFGFDLEEQGSSPNATSTLDIPGSSCRADERASEVTESEASGPSSREIFGSGNCSPRKVSEKKKVEIGTHSTTTKTPVSEKRVDKVVVAKTRERKRVIDTKKAEAAAETEAATRERKKVIDTKKAEAAAETEAATRERKKVIDIKKAEVVAEIEATPKPKPGKSLAEFAKPLDWTELSYIPLTYHISEQTLLKKFSLKENSPLRYWCYDLYTSAAGEKVNVHYCKTIEEFNRVAELFLDDKVLGFDLEWVPSNYSASKSAKVNASLMQIANESNIALFHIAKVSGQVPDFELIPPNLRRLLESENIMKTGVSVTGDAKRVSKFLGVHPAGIFELSDLWNLVYKVKTMGGSITRRLIALSRLTEECLYLPLDKSASRISNWSSELNDKQVQYAANDAYAAFRVFNALEGIRHGLTPVPKFPGCRIIPPQEPPSDNDYPIVEEEVEEDDYKPTRTNLDGPEVEKASSWATSFLEALAGSGIEAKAQHSQLKVYSLWHDGKYSVEEIAELCRTPPLKLSTVVMHILEAIRLENLPYEDSRLAELRKRIPKPFINGKYHWVFSAPNKDGGNGDVYLS